MEQNNQQQNVINNGQKKINVCALISFIVSLVGIIVAGLPCGIVAIITGILGIAKFKPETEKGKGFAIAGLIIGVIDVIIMSIYTVLTIIGVVASL